MTHLFNGNLTKKQHYDLITGGDFWSGAKNFGIGWTGRGTEVVKAYEKGASMSTFKALLPNFSDSMSQLDPDSDDFVPELYNALSDADKATLEDDKGFHFSDLFYAVPFIGLYQDTREGWDEMWNNRHPEILDRAIANYNKILKQQEAEKKVQEEKQRDQVLTDKITKEISEKFNNIASVNRYDAITSIPRITSETPIDPTRARGLY